MMLRQHILIVDPCGPDLFTAALWLERAGYQCTTAWESSQAIQKLQGSRYDLMIAEVDMPGNEGLALVEVAHRLSPGMPVILYTCSPTLQTAISAVQLRTSAYLVKPVKQEQLIKQVRQSLTDADRGFSFPAQKGKTGGTQVEATRVDQLTQALQETIQVIESTRRSFKSKELAILRKKLEHLLSPHRID